MATSGTISTTVFNTQEVVDSAHRGCRLPAAVITGEMLAIARQQLYLLLSALANAGVPLWCQTKYILPMYINRFTVPCPTGTIDVLNANLRTLSRFDGTVTASGGTAALAFDGDLSTACTQVVAGGNIILELETEMAVTNFGILPNATGAWNISLQYSDDGVTYTTFQAYPTFAAVTGEWQWFDFEGLTPHLFWRLLATAPTVLDVTELVWANNPSEIPVARVNKDDYFNLPNKQFAGRPVQYWLDRQRSVQNMVLWPAPNSAAQFQQITVLVHRHIMDVGTFQQEIEIPQRWYDAIIWQLAKKIALITPEVKPEQIELVKTEAKETLALAWMEERDDSPMYLQPNISIYTR